MPCIVKVRIISARNLPVMDRATELTDAFVEVRFSDYDPVRTQICKKTLNPLWNEDFRFEVSDDADLQNDPLEIKVMDYDQITYNDAIGTVFIDLNPLLSWESRGQMSGWFPIFDNLRGIRGEMNIQVKLQFFGDGNRFSDSSAGVQFFSLPRPSPYPIAAVLGFVSAIDIEDDPEYHWVDNFRTPRTSNDARMRCMFKLSGGLRRQLGKKVLELNGNAVIGYRQYFDFESEQRTITARAIGTAIRISFPDAPEPSVQPRQLLLSSSLAPHTPLDTSYSASPHAGMSSPIHATGIARATRSPNSEPSDVIPPTPSPPNEITLPKPLMMNYRSMDHQALTISGLPVGSILGIGGLVFATSIKIIENDQKDTRESWWSELRDEIKGHCRSLGCPFVIGYTENVTIREDLAVLYCYGTAAIVDLGTSSQGSMNWQNEKNRPIPAEDAASTNVDDTQEDGEALESQPPTSAFAHRPSINSSSLKDGLSLEKFIKRHRRRKRLPGCQSCHITYSRSDAPFPMSFSKCGVCQRKYVPEILLSTIEPPAGLDTVGKAVMIEAHVSRHKKSRAGESHASVASEVMPFIQYDIHRQLMYKLRIYGLNAVYGLKIQVSVGDALIIAVATGTAVYATALPAPPPLKVSRNLDVVDEEDKELLDIQRTIMEQSEANRKQIELALQRRNSLESREKLSLRKANGSYSRRDTVSKIFDDTKESETIRSGVNSRSDPPLPTQLADSDSDTSSDSDSEPDGSSKQRGVVVQIDDEQDEDLVLLLDPYFGEDFQMRNVETFTTAVGSIPQLGNIQMINMVKQGVIELKYHHPNRQLASLFKSTYQELQAQLWFLGPCVILGMDHTVQLLKSDEVQIRLTAAVLGKVSMLDENNGAPQSQLGEIPETELSYLLDRSNSKTGSPSVTPGPPNRQATINSMTTNTVEDAASTVSAEDIFPLEDEEPDNAQSAPEQPQTTVEPEAAAPEPSEKENPEIQAEVQANFPVGQHSIEITPLSFIPHTRVEHFLGRISLHFVKEASVLFEIGSPGGGMGGFSHVFLSELHALVRSHTAALGGNALLSFNVDQFLFQESIKNQGYSFLSVSGDVVEVTYTVKKEEMAFTKS
ncbi:hypothetical protein HDU97_008214 [Phlyctochytrium planicorne]|nr:hypothetical protein HDU97_008214 [Phlyctochytrium planicorne]